MIEDIFTGEKIRLDSLDLDRDAQNLSAWTHEIELVHLAGTQPVRPLSIAQVKQKYTTSSKNYPLEMIFAIRPLEEDHLVGLLRFYWLELTNACGWVNLCIGALNDRGHGYGKDALTLACRYAFHELNLYRLSAGIPEYNLTALRLFESAGFESEIRSRQAIRRAGQVWDHLVLGLLATRWAESHTETGGAL
jgi:RimJ/RimL family protein N-acetyltransferase